MGFVEQGGVVGERVKRGQKLEHSAHEDGGADRVVFAAQPSAIAKEQGEDAQVQRKGGVVGAFRGLLDPAIVGVVERAGGREAQLKLGGQVYISAGINWPF